MKNILFLQVILCSFFTYASYESSNNGRDSAFMQSNGFFKMTEQAIADADNDSKDIQGCDCGCGKIRKWF